MPAFQKQNLTHKTFGYWTVLRENREHHQQVQKRSRHPVTTFWVCKCICGKIKPAVRGSVLIDGRSQSCGCQRKHTLRRQAEKNGDFC